MKKLLVFVFSLLLVTLLSWCNHAKGQIDNKIWVITTKQVGNLWTWFNFWNYKLLLTGNILFSWEKKLWKSIKLLKKYSTDNWILEVYVLWTYEKVNKSMKNDVKYLYKKPGFLLLNNSYYKGTWFTLSTLMYQLNWKSYLSTFVTDKFLNVYLLKYSTNNPSNVFNIYKKITRWLVYKN